MSMGTGTTLCSLGRSARECHFDPWQSTESMASLSNLSLLSNVLYALYFVSFKLNSSSFLFFKSQFSCCIVQLFLGVHCVLFGMLQEAYLIKLENTTFYLCLISLLTQFGFYCICTTINRRLAYQIIQEFSL